MWLINTRKRETDSSNLVDWTIIIGKEGGNSEIEYANFLNFRLC
jgi:hypothetical protein